MAGSRDPRVDPRPGDVVRFRHPSADLLKDPWVVREVTAVRGSAVEWTVGRFGYSEPLDRWRLLNADAEIVKVADD